MTEVNLEDIRREYAKEGINRSDLDRSPFLQFERWMQNAIDAGLKDPTAMTLATVDASGQPNQRIVLLKRFDSQGFVFFTNYASKKAKDIDQCAKVALHFPWHSIERQVRVLGTAQKISKAESLAYFTSRPKDSQLAALASHQSSRINSRQFLMSQYESLKRKFADGELPLPDFWGGYRVVPHEFEFWQGRVSRLHDRFQYVLEEKEWTIERLAP